MRILDLDLDFFVHGAAHWRPDEGGRLDDAEFPAWDLEEAVAFLTDRCLLERPLPGFVVENHGELFRAWRWAISEGLLLAPFEVTHVDAHADLGLGDYGYMHLMTDLLYRHPDERIDPDEGEAGLGNGNYLAFAIACRWISNLIYVHNDEGGRDLMTYHLEDFDPEASNIELKAMPRDEIEKLFGLLARRGEPPRVDRREPKVPFRHGSFRDFRADRPFDLICLARSRTYTPRGADAIFDVVRERFIDESATAAFVRESGP
ncbi:MAG: hypothetical protein JWO14_2480 [Solirubrobacterales bacterium]|nr:hypothetical protein [Solirubrobacterales bacterium]